MAKKPVAFSQDIAEEICRRIAEGQSLRKICKSNSMPDKSSFLRWLEVNATLRDQYARARDAQADHYAEEILEIADTQEIGEKIEVDEKGNKKTIKGDMTEHRRLRIDARKWAASKLAPKKYGDRIHQEITGLDGSPLSVKLVDDVHNS